MLHGRVDSSGQALVQLTIHGPNGSVTCDALIDTGFSGSMALPKAVIQQLGLLQHGIQLSRYADGHVGPTYSYWGVLEWLSGARGFEMLESGVDQVIIGAGLLHGQLLTIDYGPARSVEIR
jgi:predicted aspartyl protease